MHHASGLLLYLLYLLFLRLLDISSFLAVRKEIAICKIVFQVLAFIMFNF